MEANTNFFKEIDKKQEEFVNVLLNQGEIITIAGERQTTKSTLAYKIAKKYLDDNKKVLIIAPNLGLLNWYREKIGKENKNVKYYIASNDTLPRLKAYMFDLIINEEILFFDDKNICLNKNASGFLEQEQWYLERGGQIINTTLLPNVMTPMYKLYESICSVSTCNCVLSYKFSQNIKTGEFTPSLNLSGHFINHTDEEGNRHYCYFDNYYKLND